MSGPSVTVLDRRAAPPDHPVPPDVEALCELMSGVLAAEGVPDRAEASLILVDPEEMSTLNQEHLDGTGPTDVLSFPIDGSGPVPDGHHWIAGDVVVCVEVAAEQAPGHAGTLADELALLVVHGSLHLCGWDHASHSEQDRMWARERELLARAGRSPSRDPWAAPA